MRAPVRLMSVVVCVATTVVTGCGDGGDDRSQATTAQGWLHAGDTSAWFVSLIDDGGDLSGTSNLARLGDEQLDVEHLDSAISGTRTDDEVVVTMHGQTRSGRFDGGRLTLTYTNSRGALVDVVFVPGEAAQYNAAVAELDEIAAEQQQAAADAEAKRTREQAEQREREQAAEAAAADAAELERLAAEVARQTEILDIELVLADPVTAAQTDLSTLRSEIAELDTADCADAEWEASDVTYAAGNVVYSIESAYFTIDQIGDLQLTLREAVDALEAARGSSIDSDAAIRAAETIETRAFDAFNGWYSELAEINVGTKAEVGTALTAAADRCGITTTWDGGHIPRH